MPSLLASSPLLLCLLDSLEQKLGSHRGNTTLKPDREQRAMRHRRWRQADERRTRAHQRRSAINQRLMTRVERKK